MDAFDGYVAYRLLDDLALAAEIAEMKTLIDAEYAQLEIDQELGLGMMLWPAHFFPEELWAQVQTQRSVAAPGRSPEDSRRAPRPEALHNASCPSPAAAGRRSRRAPTSTTRACRLIGPESLQSPSD
jgi:hypothetical protein